MVPGHLFVPFSFPAGWAHNPNSIIQIIPPSLLSRPMVNSALATNFGRPPCYYSLELILLFFDLDLRYCLSLPCRVCYA